MAGLGSVAGQEEIRLCVQISMVALFAPRCGDLHVLELLWAQIGTIVTNHQNLFSPYNWGSTTLTVSNIHFMPQGPSEYYSLGVFSSLLVRFRRSSITSSSAASQTLRTMSASLASTPWSLRHKAHTALCQSVSGRATLSVLSDYCVIGQPQNLPQASCLLFPASCPCCPLNLKL